MSKKKTVQGNKTYQTGPAFKDKFRPQEAKDKIQQIIEDKIKSVTVSLPELSTLTKDLAEQTKREMKLLDKDKRYKIALQVICGQNDRQGVRIGSRQFWD